MPFSLIILLVLSLSVRSGLYIVIGQWSSDDFDHTDATSRKIDIIRIATLLIGSVANDILL